MPEPLPPASSEFLAQALRNPANAAILDRWDALRLRDGWLVAGARAPPPPGPAVVPGGGAAPPRKRGDPGPVGCPALARWLAARRLPVPDRRNPARRTPAAGRHQGLRPVLLRPRGPLGIR